MMGGLVRNLFLMFADALCIGACWTFTVFGYRLCGGAYDPAAYLVFWPILPAFVALNGLFRLYHGSVFYPAAPLSPVEEVRRLFGSALILHAGVIAYFALMYQTTEGYSRVVISLSGLLTAFFSQPVRTIVRGILRRVGVGQIPAVILGSGETARRLYEILRVDAYAGFRIVGFFGPEGSSLGELPCLGSVRDLTRVGRARGVRILFACTDERVFRCLLAELTDWFTYIEYFPTARIFPIFGSRTVSFDGLGGVEMVSQARMRLLRLEKWLLDKTLAILAFVVTAPFLILIALAVRATSPGGAFFRHERLGRDSRKIRIWKFRTMYADAAERLARILAENPAAAAEWAANFKLKDDPRVTPLGRFLRKTSLDELPQIFNVLAGSMALVGPRPIVEDEIPRYGSSYATFSSVKPGVTGLWQVSGRSETDYDRRVALDSYYVLNWSPWLDLWILFRTVRAVLTLKGAC